jgi:hypothetical protein
VGLKILRKLRRTLWIAFLALGWTNLVVAAIAAILIFDAPRIAPSSGCGPGERTPCAVELRGVVTENDDGDLDVRYLETSRTVDVSLFTTGGPSVGSQVRLQYRDGDLVAVYDLRDERRYRAVYWPRRWDRHVLALALLGGAIVGCQFAARWLRRRRAAVGATLGLTTIPP